jgi:glycosyltransferase involved in cell wall biosynthesis
MTISLKRGLHLWAPAFSDFGGGITKFSRELALALDSTLPPGSVRLFAKLDRSGTWGGLPMSGSGAWNPGLRTAAFAGLLATASARNTPSVIVSTHVNFGPVAYALRRTLGTRYVLVAHGIDVHPRLSSARMRALVNADAVWAVSEWTRQRVLALGVEERRVQIVPNTLDEQEFCVGPPDAALRYRYGIAPDEKVVLTVARLDPAEGYKGYDKVLQALPQVCREIPNVRYLVVGRGGDTTRLQRLASEIGVADRLTLCGFVPDSELAAHYRLADVFAMPSLGEGFGIVFLEAMACGVPVLGGSKDGAVDALGGGALGRLVDPGALADISAALLALLRKEGPPVWFDPAALRTACLQKYGRMAFRARLRQSLADAVGETA